jgi:hypothetical protein
MIDLKQLERYAIIPALVLLGMDSPEARALLLGTAAQESGMGHYIRQVGGGPAMGIFQMEPATYHDIWRNFINNRPEIKQKLAERWPTEPEPEEMITNLLLAAVMCRLHYRRVSAPIPQADDLTGLARYWKKFYNTPMGRGSEDEFIRNWRTLVAR